MKSDVISIDSRGNGFREAIEQTGKTAAFNGLDQGFPGAALPEGLLFGHKLSLLLLLFTIALPAGKYKP